jgi:hypothetical protein
MSYAGASVAAGRATYLIDLDVVTPYFRVGDYRQQLSRQGVEVIAQQADLAKFDSPALSSEVSNALASTSSHSVLDVGGDAEGARLLGVYADPIAAQGYDLLLVCNPFRPDVSSRTLAEQRLAIEQSSGLQVTGLVANPHLGPQTDSSHLAQGWSDVVRLSRELDLRIAFIAVDERLAGRAPTVEVPTLPLHLLVRLPWETE